MSAAASPKVRAEVAQAETPALGDRRTIHVPSPPAAEAWARLCVVLRTVADTVRHDPNSGEIPQRFIAAETSLDAVVTYLQSCDGLMRQGAVASLLQLRAAMRDLAEGRQPKLLQSRSRGGRPDTDNLRAAIIGMSARAMTELMAAGRSAPDAAKEVCATLNKGRAVGFRSVKPQTIKNWRARCEEGEGADISPAAIQHYREPLPPGMGDTPSIRARNLLIVLSEAKARGFGG